MWISLDGQLFFAEPEVTPDKRGERRQLLLDKYTKLSDSEQIENEKPDSVNEGADEPYADACFQNRQNHKKWIKW